MYVSNRILSSGGAGRSAAVCGSGTLHTGPAGGVGALRRAAAAVPVSVLGGVVAAGAVPGQRPAGCPIPSAGTGNRGAQPLRRAAPAANAAAQAVRTGQLTAREADALLPACVCSGPSFVVLTVGESMLGSAELGVLLFGAQLAAGYLTAALLCRMAPAGEGMRTISVQPSPEPPHLTDVLTGAAIGYVKLCGFVLFFRMLAAGAGALLPPMAGTLCAMLLEVCSGCDLAARTGRWASLLCCAALSVQGLSVLLQVRALCPPEMTLRPLYTARLLHLPLSLGLFYLLLPGGEQSVFSTLPPQVVPMRRLPPDCLLLVFFVCCLCVCELSRLLQKPTPEPKETVVNRREK